MYVQQSFDQRWSPRIPSCIAPWPAHPAPAHPAPSPPALMHSVAYDASRSIHSAASFAASVYLLCPACPPPPRVPLLPRSPHRRRFPQKTSETSDLQRAPQKSLLRTPCEPSSLPSPLTRRRRRVRLRGRRCPRVLRLARCLAVVLARFLAGHLAQRRRGGLFKGGGG